MYTEIKGATVRTHVMLEAKAAHDVVLPPAKKGEPRRVIKLVAGDNPIAIPLWHEFGLHPATAALIEAGAIKPVCREHRFVEGQEHCLGCGYSRDGAEDAAVLA